MKPLLIIKTGETFPPIARRWGDFDDWIIRASGVSRERFLVRTVFRGERIPDPQDLAGAVITGSHAMVSDWEPWNEPLAIWLRQAVIEALPILGICYGHQHLARALGGRVGPNPRGRRLETTSIRLTPAAAADPLVGRLPRRLIVPVAHRESVLQLPPGAVLLAMASHDPHHAFRIGSCAWGIQFHPEFTLGILRAYLRLRRAVLEAEGQNVDRLLVRLRPTPLARRLLRRFVLLVGRAHNKKHPLVPKK